MGKVFFPGSPARGVEGLGATPEALVFIAPPYFASASARSMIFWNFANGCEPVM